MTSNGPIVGLTLRFDRLDNFWFCLIHELVHISKHFDGNLGTFFDDLESEDNNDSIEIEADKITNEILIPEKIWESSPARDLRSPIAAKALAKKINIDVSIVAGKMRHYHNNYRILNKLVGSNLVRKCFPDIKWR